MMMNQSKFINKKSLKVIYRINFQYFLENKKLKVEVKKD